MNTWTTTIEIPNSIIDECITAWLIQMQGSYGSIDIRCNQVERIQNHVIEIMMSVILKEVNKQIKLK